MNLVHVLIVDDEDLIRMGITKLVENMGEDFQVVGACATAREALAMLEANEIDLLITDIRMPEMDGLELLSEAKRLKEDLFSMVISGYEEFEYARTAMKLGVTDYILKPINRKQFRDQLAAIRDSIHKYKKIRFLQQDLDHQFKQTANLQIENFLNSVIYAGRLPLEQEWEALQIDSECPYRLIGISLDRMQKMNEEYSSRDLELFEYAKNGIISDITQEIQPEFPEDIRLHHCKGLDGWGWILVTHNHQDHMELSGRSALDESSERLVERLQHSFRLYLPVTVSLGISSKLTDLATITQAVAESRASLLRRLSEGGGKCFWFERQFICPSINGAAKNAAAMSARIKELENRILNVVQIYNEPALYSAVSELFKLWQTSGLRPNHLPSHVLTLMLRANLLIEEVQSDNREKDNLLSTGYIEGKWRKIQDSADIVELQEEVLKFLLLVAGKLSHMRVESDKEPVEIAKTYIGGHLAEELTLSVVSGKVYLNPSYFSNLFKIQTGENFLNYVTRIRMEKAQSLLTNRELKLNEIAVMVGYQNPKYFTKLFKEFSGITPSEYRELNQPV
ncbi:MAG: response regulator transcription factor [Bacillota bacterium]